MKLIYCPDCGVILNRELLRKKWEKDENGWIITYQNIVECPVCNYGITIDYER